MSGKQKNKGHNPGAAAKPDAGAEGAHFDVEGALTTALEHHRAGRVDKAEALYRTILLTEPNQADALHLLGVLGGCLSSTNLWETARRPRRPI